MATTGCKHVCALCWCSYRNFHNEKSYTLSVMRVIT
uniref:Uncharacterized protein n=1 Tax=Anguilla anguilla TaxID=7936 RepID=A0A0E9VZF8_ANGAN